MNENLKIKICAVLSVFILVCLACREADNSGRTNDPSNHSTAEPAVTSVVNTPAQTVEPTQPLIPSSTAFPTGTPIPSLTPGSVLDASTQDMIDQLNGLLTDLEKQNAAGDNLEDLP
jgi:hypothetical protein